MEQDELQQPQDPPVSLDLTGLLDDLPDQFQTTNPAPKPRNTGAPTSSLWDSVWGVASKTAGSVARGALEGMNEASNTVAGAALAISKGTNAYKLGRTPEERAAWLKNYEKPTETQNPFQWSEEFVDGLTGPKQSGLYGVVSGISQFAVGMVGATKALKALGIAAPTTTGARIGFEAAKGGFVDATFFKANADRLSDAVKGTVLENPISNLLESDEDDTELEGRVKNVAEGMLLGTTIDLMVAGTKAMRAARKGNMQEAARILDEATVAAETPKPTDVVTVRDVEDGVEVVPVQAAPKGFRVEEVGNTVFVHGTTAENLASIESMGRLDPTAGTRVYGDTDFHRSVAYVGNPDDPWTNNAELSASRAANYDAWVEVNLPPESKVLRLDTADDVSRLASELGFKDVNKFKMAAGDSPDVDAGTLTDEVIRGEDGVLRRTGNTVPFDASSRAVIDKIKELYGVDAIDIRPDAAEALQSMPQVVVLSPEKTRVSGRFTPPEPGALATVDAAPQPRPKAADIGGNYRAPLSTYTPTAYREMSPEAAMAFVEGGQIDDAFLASVPELAIGQSGNTGVLIELSTEGLQGQVNRSKPMWDQLYDKGTFEMVARANKPEQYAQAVRAVTVPREAPRWVARRMDLKLQQGWTKEAGGNGAVVYRPPTTNVPSVAEAAPDAATAGAKFATREEAETVAAGMNYVNKTVNHGVSVDEWANAVEVPRWAEAKRAYDEGLDPRDAAQILDNTGLNIKYDTSPDEVINVVKALADTHLEPLEIARGRPEAWAETAEKAKQLATDLGIDEDPTRAVAQAAAVFGDTDNLAARLYMLRAVRSKLADDVAKVSRAADLNPEDGDLMLALEQGLNRLNALHVYLSGSVSNTARALRQQAMVVGEGAAKEADAGAGRPLGATQAAGGTPSILDGLSQQEIRDLARSVFMTDGDPAKMMRVLLGLEQTKKAKVAVPQTQYQRVRDFALTWRMEAMLSAPTTHVGNIVSNAMVMMQRPLEYWWAGARSADKALRDFAVDMVQPMALWHDVQDSMAAMSKAFKTGLNVLDPQAPDRVGGLQEIGAGDGKPFGNALHVLGRLPSRALMSADEFFKQMNYRMNVRAQILRKARESGITDAAELQQRLKDQSKWNFAPDGSAANPWALDYARVSTFTNDLGAGTIGQSIQNLANEHPLFRVIMPFVKTPINIFRFAAERTPVLNMATAEWKAAMKSGDPERIALAKAKAEFGALFWSAGAILAYNKVITGGGPSDPGLRRQLQQAGWQPYSIRVGDRYVSYRKADPVLTAFSLVADAIEMSGELDERDLGDIATVAMASVAASVTSKSFMQGVSDFFDMISSGREDKAQAFLENTVGSFIPNILRKVDPNPYIMESQGFIEELKARTPGFSETLEPRRNLFGERIIRPPGYVGVDNVINPFTVGGVVEKPNVMNELVKLGKAMPVPEPVIRQGSNSIDLRDRDTFDDRKLPNGQNQSPYDRWLELIGETGLRSKLTAMVTDPDYQGLSEEDKLSWATGMVKAAQDEAKARMVQEYPQVQQALQMSNEMQGAVREVNADAALDGVYERYSKQFVKRKARPNVAMPE